jgi:molybdenum cofactor cytidylyltransferase
MLRRKIGLIILAAGASSRMGEPKQLLRINGNSLIVNLLDLVKKFSFTQQVLVLGANAELIQAEIQSYNFPITINADWAEGMASSIQSGLNHLLNQNTDLEAVMILLIDQPLLKKTLLEEMIEKFESTESDLVACAYNQILGVPAIFSRELFPELLALSGEAGARKVIKKFENQAISVPFPEGALDLDTPEDYEKLLKLFSL